MSESLLSRTEAAAFLSVSPRVLDSWAYKGEGPPYYRVGRHARYDLEDLRAWLATRRVEPTTPAVSLRRRRA